MYALFCCKGEQFTRTFIVGVFGCFVFKLAKVLLKWPETCSGMGEGEGGSAVIRAHFLRDRFQRELRA